MANNKIDFVILWVDGNDPAWRAEFCAVKQIDHQDSSTIRYRDWNNLQYWFRGIEMFAPWVNKIHFITWRHLPSWLDTSNPKLHIVNHSDYIPKECLPTFNSNTIELNVNKIGGLSEQFVLFNDDTFLCSPCRKEDFFRGGKPCDMARLSIVQPSSVGHSIYNCMELINCKYTKNEVINKNLRGWFSPKYPISDVIKTLTLLPWQTFAGFMDHHMPQSYLKSHFNECCEVWKNQIEESCTHQFRTLNDLSHWLIRYDALCRGEFSPRNFKDCKLMTICDDSIDQITHDIATQRYRMICMNDSVEIGDFDTLSCAICNAFEKILPQKSSYEL